MNKQLFFTVVLSGIVAAVFALPALQEEIPVFQDEDEAIIAEIMAEKEEPAKNVSAQTTATPVTTEAVAKEVKPVIEQTLAMIKPDAVAHSVSGNIIELIERNGFTILEMKKLTLTRKEAEQFYAVHKERGFFKELTNFMSSDPVIVMVLEKENGVQDWRYLMGATNPTKAFFGTIRRMFARDITRNAVHGSDSVENATNEIEFFFPTAKAVEKSTTVQA